MRRRRAWCFLTHHRWVVVAQWSHGEEETCLCRRCGELWNRRRDDDLPIGLLLREK